MASATASKPSSGATGASGDSMVQSVSPVIKHHKTGIAKRCRAGPVGGEQNAEGRDGGRVGREAEDFGLGDRAAGERRDQRVDGECVEKEGEADLRHGDRERRNRGDCE